MAKKKTKAATETLEACAFCGDKHDITTIARGLVACRKCEGIHRNGQRGRAANIRKLKDKPITDPAWGKFLEGRKK